MTAVNRRAVLAAFLSCAVTLGGCSGGGSTNSPSDTSRPLVHGALEALPWTTHLLLRGGPFGVRPAALLGVYVGSYLSRTRGTSYVSALDGVAVQMIMTYGEQGVDSTYALLQELGLALQVNIADMLNRSTDRPGKLDEYLGILRSLAADSTVKVEALERDMDELADERSEARKRAGAIQSALNRALREDDYATASQKQEELTPARAALASVEEEERQVRSTRGIYRDLLEVAEVRLLAIQENRQILIAGLKVVEVPGIEDIGLILEKSRFNRSRNNTADFLDPGPLD
jgi:hypothetical protein